MKTYKTFSEAITNFIHCCTFNNEFNYPQMFFSYKTNLFYIQENIKCIAYIQHICQYDRDEGIQWQIDDKQLITLIKSQSKLFL